jgi:hypothetical protein
MLSSVGLIASKNAAIEANTEAFQAWMQKMTLTCSGCAKAGARAEREKLGLSVD